MHPYLRPEIRSSRTRYDHAAMHYRPDSCVISIRLTSSVENAPKWTCLRALMVFGAFLLQIEVFIGFCAAILNEYAAVHALTEAR